MPKIAVLNQDGAKVSEIELNESVFASEINESAIHLVVRSQLAAKRQGTQSRRRTENLPSEGYRQCTSPWQPRTAVHTRRRGIRSEAA